MAHNDWQWLIVGAYVEFKPGNETWANSLDLYYHVLSNPFACLLSVVTHLIAILIYQGLTPKGRFKICVLRQTFLLLVVRKRLQLYTFEALKFLGTFYHQIKWFRHQIGTINRRGMQPRVSHACTLSCRFLLNITFVNHVWFPWHIVWWVLSTAILQGLSPRLHGLLWRVRYHKIPNCTS